MNTSEEYKMQCLARHVMRVCETSAQMESWFSRWEKKHGSEARAELRRYVIAEKDKRQTERDAERINQFGSPDELHAKQKLYGDTA